MDIEINRQVNTVQKQKLFVKICKLQKKMYSTCKKNLMDRINSRLEIAEKWIIEIEDSLQILNMHDDLKTIRKEHH